MLLSPTGADAFGRLLRDETRRLGMRTDGLILTDQRSAVCNMLLDADGNLTCGVADMDITRTLDSTTVSEWKQTTFRAVKSHWPGGREPKPTATETRSYRWESLAGHDQDCCHVL